MIENSRRDIILFKEIKFVIDIVFHYLSEYIFANSQIHQTIMNSYIMYPYKRNVIYISRCIYYNELEVH